MTTCGAAIIAVTIASGIIIVGLVAFAVRRVWRVADEMKQQMDAARDQFEARRTRLCKGLASPLEAAPMARSTGVEFGTSRR